MPKNASVIIFNDSKEYVETVGEIIEREGHTVIGTAGTIEGLKKSLPDWIHNMPAKPIFALVDNQAPWNDGEEADPKGVGDIADRMIKEIFPTCTTVATTSAGNDDVGYGDIRFNYRYETISIGKFLTNLPAKER